MNRGSQLFLLALLVLAVVGLGMAVIALRDTDHRSRRADQAAKIERNLKIYRQRLATVRGLAEAVAAERDEIARGRTRRQLEEIRLRVREALEIIHLQLDAYEKEPEPWVFREAKPVDVEAVKAELAGND